MPEWLDETAPGRLRSWGSGVSIRQAILDQAIDALTRGGESALRVHDVARSVGCSVSALYVHFGSREGLAEAALVERFRRLNDDYGHTLTEALHRAKSVTAVRRALSAHVAELCAPEHAPVHLARAEVVAAARTRPAVRQALVDVESQHHSALRDALVGARQRQLVRSDLDPDAIATLLRSSSMAHALALSDGSPAGIPWIVVLTKVLESAVLA